MKEVNKGLSEQVENEFKTSFNDGVTFILEKIDDIGNDPDVLYGVLNDFSNEGISGFQNLMNQISSEVVRKNICVYLYLYLLISWKKNKMEQDVSALNCIMAEQLRIKRSQLFWMGKIIFESNKELQSAFLQGIRRTVEGFYVDTQLDAATIRSLYLTTNQLWECNRKSSVAEVVHTMVEISDGDPGFFDWLCSTSFVPVIRCQAAVFMAIAQNDAHRFNGTVKSRLLPSQWAQKIAPGFDKYLLYKQGTAEIDFTNLKTPEEAMRFFTWGKQIAIQMNFPKNVIVKQKLGSLSCMVNADLPIQMDLAVSFAVNFLNRQEWLHDQELDENFSIPLAYLIAIREPAADWLIWRFLCVQTGTNNFTEQQVKTRLNRWKLLKMYQIVGWQYAPYLQVKDENLMIQKELEAFTRRGEKTQGEDFLNNFDFFGHILNSFKDFFAKGNKNIQEADAALNEFLELRKSADVGIRSYVLSPGDIRKFAPVWINLDFNLLLFPLLQGCLETEIPEKEKPNRSAFYFTASYLLNGNAFVPFVLDTQILYAVVLPDNKCAKEERKYIQKQFMSLRQLFQSLYNAWLEIAPR